MYTAGYLAKIFAKYPAKSLSGSTLVLDITFGTVNTSKSYNVTYMT